MYRYKFVFWVCTICGIVSIPLSIAAIAISTARIGTTEFDPNGFYGWIVAILSLLVTILIGWQIFNWMGIKDDVVIVKKRMEELDGKIEQVDKQITKTKSMELNQIINLSSGYENTIYSGTRVYSNSEIEALIYNRSSSDIFVISFEVYNNTIDEKQLLSRKLINTTIKGKGFLESERYTKESIYFKFRAVPVIVWTFEYDNYTYVVSCLWNDYDNISLIAKKKMDHDNPGNKG